MNAWVLRLATGLAGIVGFLLPAWAAYDSTLYFDPKLYSLLVTALQTSRQNIDVEVYRLSDRQIIQELRLAAYNGVSVRVILCPTQEANLRTAKTLDRAGVQVRWYPVNQADQIMHLKMALFDNRLLWFGSANWTHFGLTRNHEGLVFSRNANLVRQAAEQFAKDWEQADAVYPLRSPVDWSSE